jgi:hypothetical protein
MDRGTDEQGDAGGVDLGLDAAWSDVEARWDDEDAHKAFVARCVATGRLPEAGRRYREVRDRDPSRRESAAAHIDRLLSLATRNLELTRSPPPDSASMRRRLFFVALGVCLVLVGVALWAWLPG